MLRNEIESLIEELKVDIDDSVNLSQEVLDIEESEYFRGYSDSLDETRKKLNDILSYQKIYGD